MYIISTWHHSSSLLSSALSLSFNNNWSLEMIPPSISSSHHETNEENTWPFTEEQVHLLSPYKRYVIITTPCIGRINRRSTIGVRPGYSICRQAGRQHHTIISSRSAPSGEYWLLPYSNTCVYSEWLSLTEWGWDLTHMPEAIVRRANTHWVNK